MNRSIDDETDYAHTCFVCGDGLLEDEGVECDFCKRRACEDHASDAGQRGYICSRCFFGCVEATA